MLTASPVYRVPLSRRNPNGTEDAANAPYSRVNRIHQGGDLRMPGLRHCIPAVSGIGGFPERSPVTA